MRSARKLGWQQATALVSLSTCGAMTGFSLAHGTVGDMTSPTSLPVHVLDFSRAVRPAGAAGASLGSAIVKVANYYLRMARDKTPAEMEAIIWQSDSADGVDHGASCAAFASLTLEMGAQSVGQQSWVTGGGSYPYPLHKWADVRVDPNPASPSVMSIMQQAQAAGRWRPIGDGYQPRPGDWAMFDGHVEVVTKYSRGVLYTIGADSLPDFSVNAHSYRNPLSAQGVTGFVNNGELLGAASPASDSAAAVGTATGGGATGGGATTAAVTAGIQQQGQRGTGTAKAGQAAVPGTGTAALTSSTSQFASPGPTAGRGTATVTGPARKRSTAARKGAARMVGTAGGPASADMRSAVAMPGLMAGAGIAAGNGTASTGAFNAGAVSSAVGEAAASGHGNNMPAGTAARTGSAARMVRGPDWFRGPD